MADQKDQYANQGNDDQDRRCREIKPIVIVHIENNRRYIDVIQSSPIRKKRNQKEGDAEKNEANSNEIKANIVQR